MSSKAWVEEHVGKLLKQQMPYVYKPVDAGPNGGATKLDFLIVDPSGFGGGVEVKQTANKGYYTPNVKDSSGLSPGQRQALNEITSTARGIGWVAVWAGRTCFFYDWRVMRERLHWEWSDAFEARPFHTWSEWLATPLKGQRDDT